MLDGRPLETIFTSIQQRLEAAVGSSTGTNVHTTQEHGGGRTAHLDFQVEELEDVSIRFLSAHSKTTNWKQIVSLQNDFGQTMAHIAVMLGYPRLLGSLIGWEIDLNLTDLHGATALHYASLCNKSACAILLIQSGADELALDELGRSAMSLNPFWAEAYTTRLLGVPKVDGGSSVSYRPAEEELKTEHPEEAAALEASYLLVHRWLQQMEEEQRNINHFNGEDVPQPGVSPPCSPSNLGDGNGKSPYTIMSSPPPGPGDLGADDQGERPVAEQESKTRSNEDTDSSSDEEMGPGSPKVPGQGELQAYLTNRPASHPPPPPPLRSLSTSCLNHFPDVHTL